MPGRGGRRLVPLGRKGTAPNFRWLEARGRFLEKQYGESKTNWASCAILEGVKTAFKDDPKGAAIGIGQAGSPFISGRAVGMAVTIFASTVFSGLTLPAVTGYKIVSGGIQVLKSTGAAGRFGLALTSLGSMSKPKFTNFNKPCRNPPRL